MKRIGFDLLNLKIYFTTYWDVVIPFRVVSIYTNPHLIAPPPPSMAINPLLPQCDNVKDKDQGAHVRHSVAI
jgi:hypothetical protein